MNENLNLVEILKDCPKGTKLYTPIWGEVVFIEVRKNKNCPYPICIDTNAASSYTCLAKDGRYLINREESECILFPSKDQRDWSKFKVKKPKFDPKTLKPFDRVLVRLVKDDIWNATLFSHHNKYLRYPFITINSKNYSMCIPYNDEIKHLVGTEEEAPKYYRYWED